MAPITWVRSEPVAAELAARDNIRIFIGVGADEMRIRLTGTDQRTNDQSSADLDEDTLQAIADATGGQYFRARDPRTLMEIYALIDQLEPVEQEAEIFRPVQALYFGHGCQRSDMGLAADRGFQASQGITGRTPCLIRSCLRHCATFTFCVLGGCWR